MNFTEVIARLPYTKPFLFVDELVHIDANGAEGNFTFDEKMDFYKGHFINNPVTPGVILTEVMAQIGVVCLGIFLTNNAIIKNTAIALTSVNIEFIRAVYPNEKVTVISKKKYFRFGKLKCDVSMKNQLNEQVCMGTIAGMIISKNG